jgi:hypothetical protein
MAVRAIYKDIVVCNTYITKVVQCLCSLSFLKGTQYTVQSVVTAVAA